MESLWKKFRPSSIKNYILSLHKGAWAAQKTEYTVKKLMLQQSILHSTESGVCDNEYIPGQRIIVSLTSYSKRVYEVAETIESLMQQTMKPNMIILWLEQAHENTPLPEALTKLTKRGLTIEYCKDIKSYKKLIPALKKFPDDAIITVDDDCLYAFDALEHLIRAYQADQKYIYCHRKHLMTKDRRGRLKPYDQWKRCIESNEASALLFPVGVGGILYPPHSLDEEVLNEDVFLDICPYADDIWFKAMALKKGTLPKGVYSHNYRGDFLINDNVQDIGLERINALGNCLNNSQLEAVFTRYNLYPLLTN